MGHGGDRGGRNPQPGLGERELVPQDVLAGRQADFLAKPRLEARWREPDQAR